MAWPERMEAVERRLVTLEGEMGDLGGRLVRLEAAIAALGHTLREHVEATRRLLISLERVSGDDRLR